MSLLEFRHKALKELNDHGTSPRIAQSERKKLLKVLTVLGAAKDPRDFSGLAGYHPLNGKRRDTLAIKVTANWRLTFKWTGKDVTDIDYEDYH